MRQGECWPLGLAASGLIAACAAPAPLAPASEPGLAPLAAGGATLEVRLGGHSKTAQREVAALPGAATYKITLSAADIQTPMVATASAAPALQVKGVPPGDNRLIVIEGLDAAAQAIAGSQWAGVVSIASTGSITLTPATTAVGRVWKRWLATGKTLLATSSEPGEVLERLDGIRLAARAPHFNLVDAAAWADAAAAAGSIDPAGTFGVAAATVDVTVLNAPEDAPADLWIDDPVSPMQTGVSPGTSLSAGRYSIGPVEPGTWTARISVPGMGIATASITASAGGTTTATLAFAGWESEPPLPAAIGNSAVTTDGTSIYVVGGVTASGAATDSAWVIDTTAANPAWVALPDVPRAREASRAAILGTRLYVVGGMSNGSANWSMYSLDLGDPTSWTTELSVSAPTATNYGCCASIPVLPTGVFGANGKLYVVYPTSASSLPFLTGNAKSFDPASPAWTAAADVPAIRTPRLSAGFAEFNQGIVVAGGNRGTTFEGFADLIDGAPILWEGGATVEALSFGATTWNALTDLRGLRAEVALAAAGNLLFAAGGVDSGSRALRTVDRYDPVLATWLPSPPLAEARSAFGLVFAGGKLWAVGGAPSRDLNFQRTSKAVVSATVESFDPGTLP